MKSFDNTESPRVTLLANSGIMLEYKGTKLLIDGTPGEIHGYFSGLSDEVRNDLLEGKKPLFRDIDILMYTHCHHDHFSPEVTRALVEGQRTRYLMMPDKDSRPFVRLRESADMNEAKLWLLDIPLGKIAGYELDGIKIEAFRTMHAGELYRETEHYCYLIELGDKVILITGDSDYDPDYFKTMLSGIRIHAVFINPLFLNRREGRLALTESIRPDKIVVCHIPFEGTPGTNLRKIAARDAVKYKEILPEIILLQDELQEIFL
ncbi:MBL fold metallo-hydrolase [Youngiibacter multivorans]|uniref:L-ascorbate metabolism protein UlaG (Beta-lactamase superfamily) n=1 Tax=Youngiibacter multivorans TaxID=937251 RepID=A0ABS4G502_9CLOT|nr:MBL fold metallo-hydrolase [Youngiibacter multivorans]MBP1919632.1 L-ascorbate metabolism protein UlaG (beta-lactamase superfamily) [Youngiibacter multivorans]